jgi:hypothetical protein
VLYLKILYLSGYGTGSNTAKLLGNALLGCMLVLSGRLVWCHEVCHGVWNGFVALRGSLEGRTCRVPTAAKTLHFKLKRGYLGKILELSFATRE